MKNQFLVLILILFPFLAAAQPSTGKNVQLGFTLTPNIGWLRFNDNKNISSDGSRIGFSYGVLGDFSLTPTANYYFSTAFALTSVNAKTSAEVFNPGTSSYTYKIQYIEIPLTLKLKSNEMMGKRYYGQFGLGTGITIGAKGDGPTLVGGDVMAEDNNRNISENINVFRLGLVAGGGVEWKLDQNLDLQTGITFNNGFTDIFDGDPNARSSYFAFNLGIFF